MSRVIVITGMHRSGTSLTTSLLQSAGIKIGEKLLPPAEGNPRGYFEDVEFYQFQEQALRGRGLNYMVTGEFVFEPNPTESEQALAIIKEREGLPVWGWKDPRTCLFLEFWRQLLPGAFFLFVYRHPLEVLLSLIRRGDVENFGLEGIDAWVAYNRSLKRFCERHRESSLLCHIDGITRSLGQFAELLERKFCSGLRLDNSVLQSLYWPEELRRVSLSSEIEKALGTIHPEAVELYDQLNSIADLPSKPEYSTSRSSPELSAFSEFVSSLSRADDSGRRRALLLFLTSALEPDTLVRFLKRQAEYFNEIEMRHFEHQRAIDTQQAEHQRAIDTLQAGHQMAIKAQQAEHQMAIETQRAEHQRAIETQRAEHLREMEEARAWFADQQSNWRNLAQGQEQTVQELRVAINELEQAMALLDSERSDWQNLAEQHGLVIKQQAESLTSLESELTFWESIARRFWDGKWMRLGLKLGIVRSPNFGHRDAN
ncbi:MAG: sulfotransferase [Chloroflexi bacterium]|nr:sulfotransferase [Chloroflexota bacterium]